MTAKKSNFEFFLPKKHDFRWEYVSDLIYIYGLGSNDTKVSNLVT
jgi:hypothetical protein